MNPYGIDPYMVMEVNRQHERLIKKIEMERLVKEAFRDDRPKTQKTSKFLALIGRKLAGFGAKLEERFNIQSDKGTTLEKQSTPGGCS